MSPPWRDRREHPRLLRLVRVQVELGGRTLDAVTADVGPGGAFVKTREMLPLGSTLLLRFLVPEGVSAEIAALARVVRAVRKPGLEGPVPGYGVMWIRIHASGDPPTVRSLLQRYFGSVDALPLAAGGPGGSRPKARPGPGGEQTGGGGTSAPAQPGKKPVATAASRRGAGRPVQGSSGTVNTGASGTLPAPPRLSGWQAIRLRALAEGELSAVTDNVEGTRPEVPAPRHQSGSFQQPADEFPVGAGRAGAERATGGPRSGDPLTRPEWREEEPGSRPSETTPAAPSSIDLDQICGAGIPVDAPVTYRIRSLFFVGRLRVVGNKIVYVVTLQHQPSPGNRVLVNIPLGQGQRGRTFTLITHVDNVDPATERGPGGFEATIMGVDERGNQGAFRAYLRRIAREALGTDLRE